MLNIQANKKMLNNHVESIEISSDDSSDDDYDLEPTTLIVPGIYNRTPKEIEYNRWMEQQIRDMKMAMPADMGPICGICLHSVADQPEIPKLPDERPILAILNCGNAFHDACIREWWKGKNQQICPECQKPTAITEMVIHWTYGPLKRKWRVNIQRVTEAEEKVRSRDREIKKLNQEYTSLIEKLRQEHERQIKEIRKEIEGRDEFIVKTLVEASREEHILSTQLQNAKNELRVQKDQSMMCADLQKKICWQQNKIRLMGLQLQTNEENINKKEQAIQNQKVELDALKYRNTNLNIAKQFCDSEISSLHSQIQKLKTKYEKKNSRIGPATKRKMEEMQKRIKHLELEAHRQNWTIKAANEHGFTLTKKYY